MSILSRGHSTKKRSRAPVVDVVNNANPGALVEPHVLLAAGGGGVAVASAAARGISPMIILGPLSAWGQNAPVSWMGSGGPSGGSLRDIRRGCRSPAKLEGGPSFGSLGAPSQPCAFLQARAEAKADSVAARPTAAESLGGQASAPYPALLSFAGKIVNRSGK